MRIGHYDPAVDPTDYRALLQFDVADAVPPNAVIRSARLGLSAENADGPMDSMIDAYSVTRPWTTDASWTHASSTTDWSTPGGDVSASLDSQLGCCGPSNPLVWWDVTAAVQAWLTGGDNDGLLLAGSTNEDMLLPDFSSPRLEVTYVIDDTPPSVPSGFDVDYGSDGVVTVTWDDSDDPPLADGMDGSGVAGYRFRYQLADGTWSAWVETPDDADIPDAVGGQTYQIEVQSFDEVGNTSATASASVTVPIRDAFDDGDLQWFSTHDATDATFDQPYDPNGIDQPLDDTQAAAVRTDSASATSGFATASSTPMWMTRLNALERQTACTSSTGESGSISPSQTMCVIRDPRAKTKRKAEELECGEEIRDELGRTRARRDCPQDFDEDIPWYDVYVYVSRSNSDKVIYVGMTSRTWDVRCPEHPGVDKSRCRLVERVPGRFMARAVEQFLIEVYGFAPGGRRQLNEDFDTREVLFNGWFNGFDPTLINRIRSVGAARPTQVPLYCAAKMTGFVILNLYRPQNFPLNVHPPGRLNWWPNFPSRDCISIDSWQNHLYNHGILLENKPIANPR